MILSDSGVSYDAHRGNPRSDSNSHGVLPGSGADYTRTVGSGAIPDADSFCGCDRAVWGDGCECVPCARVERPARRGWFERNPDRLLAGRDSRGAASVEVGLTVVAMVVVAGVVGWVLGTLLPGLPSVEPVQALAL